MRMLLPITVPHETFNADVQFHPVMSQDDLAKAGLEALGKKCA